MRIFLENKWLMQKKKTFITTYFYSLVPSLNSFGAEDFLKKTYLKNLNVNNYTFSSSAHLKSCEQVVNIFELFSWCIMCSYKEAL